MCGRSSLTKTEKEIEQRFQSTFYSDELERYNPLPNYNIAPTHMCPVITNQDPNRIHLYRWGLIPFWAKDMKIGYKMINARKETIIEKKTYKSALKSRRCIVPVDGFYEWKKDGGTKTPYRIQVKDVPIFTIAGLWESWNSPENEEILTFTLITQEPNEFMAEIHNRMPAILMPDQERLWLDNEVSTEELMKLITPIDSELMTAYEVPSAVGNVKNNSKELIEPVEK